MWVACKPKITADHSSDADGQLTFSSALAGGSSADGMQVFVMGVPVDTPPLDIRVVSADLNGDLGVDMLDVVEFALRFNPPTPDWTVDLNCDGAVNLLDAIRLSAAIGASCLRSAIRATPVSPAKTSHVQ